MTDQNEEVTVDGEVVEAEVVEPEFSEPIGSSLVARETFTPSKIEGGMAHFDQYLELADRIAKTAMVPNALRGNGDQVLAVFMYGAELGMGPMQALNQINFIEGQPSLKPEAMRALIRKAGHTLDISRSNIECIIVGTRGDTGETGEASFSIEDAERADLLTITDPAKGTVRARSGSGKVMPWESYTADMLLARATSRIARMMFSDVIAGLSYTPEEIESFTERPEPRKAQGAAKKARQARKGGTTRREPPATETDEPAATNEVKVEFATAMALITDPQDVEELKKRWTALKPALPPSRLLVTQRDYERALALAKGVLNQVGGDTPSEGDEGESGSQGATSEASGDLPKMITPNLIKRLNIRAGEAGYADRVKKLARISEIVGQRCYSTKNLTMAQATKVIDVFDAEIDDAK